MLILLFGGGVNRIGGIRILARAAGASREVLLEADDIDIAAELIILAVGASRLNHIEVDASLHELAAVTSQPPLGSLNSATLTP